MHSQRVSEHCKNIALANKVDTELITLAEFAGLTHDLGRFTQWQEYKTFDDAKSFDHAHKSADILFNSLIYKFNIPRTHDLMLKSAIKNHNKNIVKKDNLLGKILRDADKIDILYMLSNKEIILDEDNKKISSSVDNAFWKHTTIDKSNTRSYEDKIIMKLAFVFDLNYETSFKYLTDNNIIDKIYDNLKYKDIIKKYYKEVRDFVWKNIKK